MLRTAQAPPQTIQRMSIKYLIHGPRTTHNVQSYSPFPFGYTSLTKLKSISPIPALLASGFKQMVWTWQLRKRNWGLLPIWNFPSSSKPTSVLPGGRYINTFHVNHQIGAYLIFYCIKLYLACITLFLSSLYDHCHGTARQQRCQCLLIIMIPWYYPVIPLSLQDHFANYLDSFVSCCKRGVVNPYGSSERRMGYTLT